MPRTPWAGSTRRQRLPANWPQLVKQVKARDRGRCQAPVHVPKCDGIGTDVDHIIEGDDHRLTNLMLLSGPCHVAKTSRENAERNRARTAARIRPDRHPGAIP